MLKTFVLIAYLASGHAFTIDHDLTGADCIAFLLAMSEADAIEIEPGNVVPVESVTLACELSK